MDRWAGKVALVTGASAGIGAAIVSELLKYGMKVVGVARRVELVEALKLEFRDSPGTLYPLKADISKENEIDSIFNWIRENLQTVHVLINNAGFYSSGKILDGDPKHWRTTLDINVIGLCICTQQAFKLMKEAGVDDGHIIHINSVAGHKVSILPDPVVNMYPASKHAVTALTETLRQELRFLKTKTRVTSISPGYVDTEFRTANANESKSKDVTQDVFKSFTPLQPKDIADAVIYVLSTPSHVQVHELTIRPLEQPF